MSQVPGLTQQRSKRLLESLPAIVFEYVIGTDGSHDLSYISPRCEEVLGVNQEMLMKGVVPFKNLIHPHDWPGFFESTRDSIRSACEWKWEGRLNKNDGEVWIEASGVPSQTKEGAIIFSGLISEISERKILERKHFESEQRYMQLVDHLPLGIGIHAEGVLVYANKYALHMMAAQNPEELVGKSILDFVHPNFKDVVMERVNKVMKGEHAEPIEEKYIRLDGKIIDVETSAHPFTYQGIPAVQIISKDITETKEAQVSVKKVQRLFSQLFQNSPMAVVMLDAHGNVEEVNSGFEELFGYAGSELKGKGLNTYIVPEELEAEGNDLNSLISSYQVIRIETVRRNKAGDLLSVILYGVPVHMDDQTIGIFGVYVDITERKKVEEELKIRNTELDNFVYKVSHDLRAPLSSILGLVNLANMPANDDNPKAYMNLIGKKVEQLDHFISDVLSHSKNLKLDIKIGKIDLQNIIEQTFADLNYLKGAEQVKKEVLVQGVEFYSDPWRLAEVFRNLVSNSIKYRRFDIDNPFVTIVAKVDKDTATIYFKDNGIGIDADKVPHIFSMFYRASSQSEGSGLGLYIVKNAVDKLNGQIEVTSEPLVGTEFKIILPNKSKTP